MASLTSEELFAQISNFFWVVSPMYRDGSRASLPLKWWQPWFINRKTARDRFNEAFKIICNLPTDKVVGEILEYLKEAFIDSEESRQTDSKNYFAFEVQLAAELHKHYGYRIDFWNPNCQTERNPVHVPLKIVFQLRKLRKKMEGQPVENQSEKMLMKGLENLGRN